MNKTLNIIVLIVIVILGGWYLLAKSPSNEVSGSNPLNIAYLINGESFELADGLAEKEIAPNSATKNKVSVFGEPSFGDIDRDGDDDAVLILVNDSGGSGTFYYGAIAVNTGDGYKGTDTILLGDRVAPQTFYVEDNRAKINYTDRVFGEDFSVSPSIGKSIHLQFDSESLRLIEVAVDFEGEADPNIMTLDMHTWRWIKTTYNNDTEVAPNKSGVFTLTFKDDGTFSATTDCNSMSGGYEVDDKKISFGRIATTLMFCEDSQETEFSSMFEEIESFFFTSRGELIFDLKFDSGSVIFR